MFRTKCHKKQSLNMLDLVRIIITFFLLLYAAYTDYERRRVPNTVFIIGTLLGSLILFADLISGSISEVYLIAFSVTSLSLIGYLIYKLGYFGGADAKCMMFLSVIVPISFQSPFSATESILSISTISNGAIISLVYPLYLGFKNRFRFFTDKYRIFLYDVVSISSISDKHGKIVCSDNNSRVDVEDLNNLLEWVGKSDISDITREDVKEFKSNNMTFTRDLDYSSIQEISTNKKVKMRPGLPLVTLFYFGFLSSLLVGDFISIIIVYIMF